jgi:small-conductance mechanosensitive channel
VETSRLFDVQDEVNSRIKDGFDKAGIEFALPSRTIYVKD